jgi:hypothetical protein
MEYWNPRRQGVGLRFRLVAAADKGVRALDFSKQGFVGPGQGFELGLHLGLQGKQLGLVPALALLCQSLQASRSRW